MTNNYINLFRDKKFFLIWLGQVLSKLGDALDEIALIWIAIKVSGDNYLGIGLVFFIRFLPYLIFGILGGVYSDRLNRKHIMIVTDIARGLVVTSLPILIFLNRLELWHLAAVSLILTILRSFFQPALQAFVPDILKKEQLIHANALLQASYEFSGVIGPAIGGFLLSITSPAIVFIIDAMTFFMSAFAIFLISYRYRKNLEPKESPNGILVDFKETVDLLLQKTHVMWSILLSAAAILSIAGILRLAIPSYTSHILAGDSKLLGTIMSVMGLGTVVGALIIGKVSIKSYEKLMFLGWAVYGLLLGIMGLTHQPLIAIFIAHFVGVFGAVVDVLLVSIIQINIPIKFMGKTFGFFSTLANVGDSISGLLIGYLLTKFPIPYIFLFGGGSAVLIGFLGIYLVSQWQKRSERIALR
ncbi:MAG: MFS transporter [Iphinoe sp. HA4291-MV1]|jgi:MFS family permease|nr:MFS transporter [Iphinoe sp. HA4291-MV1]